MLGWFSTSRLHRIASVPLAACGLHVLLVPPLCALCHCGLLLSGAWPVQLGLVKKPCTAEEVELPTDAKVLVVKMCRVCGALLG